jgi:hypothetical protein
MILKKESGTVNASSMPPIADLAPSEARLTDYDRSHVVVYLRMLDALKDGAPWEEVSRIVLGLDPLREPARAKAAYDTHLARAQWLTKQGYKEILANEPR